MTAQVFNKNSQTTGGTKNRERHKFMKHRILLSSEDVANILGLSPATIRDWRWQRIGPPFLAISARCVRYDQAKLEEWIEQQTVEPIRDDQ
jgi:predicted DNA-binding transcriptional regulator AlpA